MEQTQSKTVNVYPFARLEVGDFFFVPRSDGQVAQRVHCAVWRAHKRFEGRQFKVEVQDQQVLVKRVL